MTQDQTSGIVAASIAAAHPVFGDYGPIVVGAVFGSLMALSRMKSTTRPEAAWFILLNVGLASIFTGVVAKWVATLTTLPAGELLAPVACLIAWIGNDWHRIKDWFIRSKTS